jgi:hypothetical protein
MWLFWAAQAGLCLWPVDAAEGQLHWHSRRLWPCCSTTFKLCNKQALLVGYQAQHKAVQRKSVMCKADSAAMLLVILSICQLRLLAAKSQQHRTHAGSAAPL